MSGVWLGMLQPCQQHHCILVVSEKEKTFKFFFCNLYVCVVYLQFTSFLHMELAKGTIALSDSTFYECPLLEYKAQPIVLIHCEFYIGRDHFR